MSLLDDVVLDGPRHQPQIVGPQAGRVLRVDGVRLLVSLDAFPSQEFACSWGAPDVHDHTAGDGVTGANVPPAPPAGTRCLVLFAGQGIADPWVVQFAGWPS